jgi:hypothetical protein
MAQTNTQTEALYAQDGWTVQAQATAGTPSASKAAGAAGVRHYATGVEISAGAGGTALSPVIVNLRDGATGAGTILASWVISCATTASSPPILYTFPKPIPGSAATAMTLECASASAATTVVTLVLHGFDA